MAAGQGEVVEGKMTSEVYTELVVLEDRFVGEEAYFHWLQQNIADLQNTVEQDQEDTDQA